VSGRRERLQGDNEVNNPAAYSPKSDVRDGKFMFVVVMEVAVLALDKVWDAILSAVLWAK